MSMTQLKAVGTPLKYAVQSAKVVVRGSQLLQKENAMNQRD